MQCAITSPPYYGLRDYGDGLQIGNEPTLGDYVQSLVEVLAEIWQVLAADGVVWLNLGDGWMDKRLLGIPWSVAMAAADDGWIVRDEVIWSKTNVMPSSVKDRCTRSHEHIFMLTKQKDYYYNNEAIMEPLDSPPEMYLKRGEWNRKHQAGQSIQGVAVNDSSFSSVPAGRNKRSVWSMAPSHYHGEHYATFPESLVDVCLRATTRPGDLCLDPFAGSGTVGVVAERLGRRWILLDISYQDQQKERIKDLQRSLF